MLNKSWYSLSIFLLSTLFVGTGLVFEVRGNDEVGYVLWLIGLILIFVYRSASNKAKADKAEAYQKKNKNKSKNNLM